MINQSVSIDLSNKISRVTLENSNLPTDILNKEDYNGMCFVETTTYTPGQRCPNEHSWEYILGGGRCTFLGAINGPLPGSYTTSATLQPCPTGGGDASGGTGTSSSSSTSSYNGGSGGTGGPNTITTSPVNNCITGNCIEANPTDPCSNSNTAVANANALFNSPQVQQGMNAVLSTKLNNSATNDVEWAVGIGQTATGFTVTPVAGGVSNESASVPVSQVVGTYVADGHNHPNGNGGDPSAGDLYGMLNSIQVNTNLKYRFVYANNIDENSNPIIDVYVLIVTDPNAAQEFLTQFPEIQNTNFQTHDFMEDTKLGADYLRARDLFWLGFSSNLSNETYTPGAIGIAAILDKNNAGICIAKKDANGNFKKINATLVEKTDANGNKTKEVIVSKCQ